VTVRPEPQDRLVFTELEHISAELNLGFSILLERANLAALIRFLEGIDAEAHAYLACPERSLLQANSPRATNY
jgi:hypothetical protein